MATREASTATGSSGIGLAVYSIWLRELRRFWRQKTRLAGAIGTPLVFWLVLGAGFGGSFRPVGTLEGTPYLEYFFPGAVILAVLFTAIYSTISVIEDRQEGFLQGMLVAPVARSGIIIGKMLGGATLASAQGALMLLLAPVIGVTFGWEAVICGLAMLLLTAYALTGLGLMIAWIMDSSSGFHAIMNLLLMPMWLLSGAVFPFTQAHPVIKAAMILNPLTYAMAGFRRTVYLSSSTGGSRELPLWLCVLVTVGFALFTMFASIRLADRKGETGI